MTKVLCQFMTVALFCSNRATPVFAIGMGSGPLENQIPAHAAGAQLSQTEMALSAASAFATGQGAALSSTQSNWSDIQSAVQGVSLATGGHSVGVDSGGLSATTTNALGQSVSMQFNHQAPAPDPQAGPAAEPVVALAISQPTVTATFHSLPAIAVPLAVAPAAAAPVPSVPVTAPLSTNPARPIPVGVAQCGGAPPISALPSQCVSGMQYYTSFIDPCGRKVSVCVNRGEKLDRNGKKLGAQG